MFKNKVNIVESKTPPTNKNDWWYDLNTQTLKRYTGGAWNAIIAGSSDIPEEPIVISDTEQLRTLILNKELIPGAYYYIPISVVRSNFWGSYNGTYVTHKLSPGSGTTIKARANGFDSFECAALLYEDVVVEEGYISEAVVPCIINITTSLLNIGHIFFFATLNHYPDYALVYGSLLSVNDPTLEEDDTLQMVKNYAIEQYGSERACMCPYEMGISNTGGGEEAICYFICDRYNINNYILVDVYHGYPDQLSSDVLRAPTLVYDTGVLSLSDIDNRFDAWYSGLYGTHYIDDISLVTSTANLDCNEFSKTTSIKNSCVVGVDFGDPKDIAILDSQIRNTKLVLTYDMIKDSYLDTYAGPACSNMTAINSSVSNYDFVYSLMGPQPLCDKLFTKLRGLDLYLSHIETGIDLNSEPESSNASLVNTPCKLKLHYWNWDYRMDPSAPILIPAGFNSNSWVTIKPGSGLYHSDEEGTYLDTEEAEVQLA